MPDKIFTIKFSEMMQEMLNELLEKTGTMSKSDVIRRAIMELHQKTCLTKNDQN